MTGAPLCYVFERGWLRVAASGRLGGRFAVANQNPNHSFISDESDLVEADAGQSAADSVRQVSAADADAGDILDRTKSELKGRAKARFEKTLAQRADITGTTIRLYTTTQMAAICGVSKQWFIRNRELFPLPIRLGDARNPRAPLRWRESDVKEWLDKQAVETRQHRATSQPRPGAGPDSIRGGRRSGD
jgi:predicted DNA-binding transcriptional regulator AlpA